MTTPPSPAPDLSPEDCYARAVDHLSAGRTERAIKLLQVAALKAPHESRYREALREAKNILSEQAREVDPEALFTQAQAILTEGGDTEMALRLLKIARARQPGEPRYREALERLQQARQPQKTELEEHGARITREATEEVSRPTAPEITAARVAVPVRARRRVLLSLLAIMGISTFLSGVSLWLQMAQSVPTDPYQTLLPAVVRARAVGEPLRNELILTVSEDAWRVLSSAERETAARSLLRRAQMDDFMVVYLYSSDQRLLATAHPERLYFPP